MVISKGSCQGPASLFAILLTVYVLITSVVSVKHENFKTCDQSGFCKRNRAYADEVSRHGNRWEAPYALNPASVSFSQGTLLGTVLKTVQGTDETVRLPLTITFLESGAARVTVDEERRKKGDIVLRHDSKARKERYNEAQQWAIVGGLEVSKGAAFNKDTPEGTLKVVFGPRGNHEAVIRYSPFGIEFRRDGETHVKLNERGLMNVEHWRAKMEKPEKKEGEEEQAGEKPAEDNDPDESTWWEESFGGNKDSKPRGPESVALDVTFPGYEHVFGIPSHAGPLSLKETRGGDGNYDQPYRMYNSDIFEYIIDSPMTLYGSIPFMQAHRQGSTVGVFWLNAAETWVDIVKSKTSSNPLSLGIGGRTDTQTHWISESGLLDIFVLFGPTPQDMSKTFADLTGYTDLPPESAIAYHQCRWNYVTDQDVKDVDRKMDRHNIPYDVIWLDIEYTDGKKYFTWDGFNFPDPLGMQKQLAAHERKLVVIIDPHIKKESGYFVVDEMTSKGLAVKNKEGSDYDGWCWPGSSHWIDAFSPAAREWWTSLFTYEKFKGMASNTYIWNDMNEPSVFNGPETTMPKDNLHHDGWEHRDVHNINGMTFVNATYGALLQRDMSHPNRKKTLAEQGAKRPFVLTRSFFAGSQRLGAMWTGDNQADWTHLQASLPMILSQGIAGFPFAGADVGGFFGNPSKELLTRWYQAGAFYPFMRGHAHIDTRRREPYLAGSPYTEIITRALRLRYSLLPAWYTAFHEASTTGAPIVRPMWWTHPEDSAGFALDDQLYLGSTGLLVKPVTTEGAESVSVHLPAGAPPYYSYTDFQIYTPHATSSRSVTVPAPLDTLPLLMRAGHIFPRRDRPRRSAPLMRHDPISLVVVLDPAAPHAAGSLYLDDGSTFAYTAGAFVHRRFVFDAGVLMSTDAAAGAEAGDAAAKPGSRADVFAKDKAGVAGVQIGEIVVVGAPDTWAGKSSVTVRCERAGGKTRSSSSTTGLASLRFHAADRARGTAAWAVVRAPGVGVAEGWSVSFE